MEVEALQIDKLRNLIGYMQVQSIRKLEQSTEQTFLWQRFHQGFLTLLSYKAGPLAHTHFQYFENELFDSKQSLLQKK